MTPTPEAACLTHDTLTIAEHDCDPDGLGRLLGSELGPLVRVRDEGRGFDTTTRAAKSLAKVIHPAGWELPEAGEYESRLWGVDPPLAMTWRVWTTDGPGVTWLVCEPGRAR